jgi:hypothetical protein
MADIGMTSGSMQGITDDSGPSSHPLTAPYYSDVSAECALQDVPLGPQPDLSAPFTFIPPNLCHDMHCSPCATASADEDAAGAAWLAQFLPTIFTTLVVAPPVAPGTAVARDGFGL